MKAGIDNISKSDEKKILNRLFDDNSSDSSESESETCEQKVDDSVDISSDSTAYTKCNEKCHLNDLIEKNFQSNRINILLKQNATKGIAFQLWPAAEFLCNYFDENYQNLIENDCESIIELGAGIGLCGIYLAKLLKHTNLKDVYITDLQEAIPLICENISLNNQDSNINVHSRVLSWDNSEEITDMIRVTCYEGRPLPLIIAADCIYWECLFVPFYNTLKEFIDQGCTVILSHVRRWKKDNKFFALCRKNNLKVEILHECKDMVLNENTNESNRRISRIYKISGSK